MISLYQIEKNYLEIVEQILEGELTPELEEALAINKEELQNKGTNYGMVIKQLEGEAGIIDAEIKRLQQLKKSRETVAEKLKENIKTAMSLYGIDEIKSPLFKISFRKSESVEVQDIERVPNHFKKAKVEWQADKAAIKAAIKEGIEVPGASLKVNQNVQIK